ncbi:hypothetical protein OC842_002142 [Tilletia horrida]|uniref:Uncharacterized protein n=1 Tax=Tilletia horrida TaxID=155126 RepID=A0AAN6JLX0_9BASI|nr:hypothetical protein OC842_002142 [Tilletia horrida]
MTRKSQHTPTTRILTRTLAAAAAATTAALLCLAPSAAAAPATTTTTATTTTSATTTQSALPLISIGIGGGDHSGGGSGNHHNGTLPDPGSGNGPVTPPGNGTVTPPGVGNGTATPPATAGQGGYSKFPSPFFGLSNNNSFIDLAISTIHASQRAAWEQGVTVQAVLEWQYPEWSTYDAPGPNSFKASSGRRAGRKSYPQDVVLWAMRSIVAQDSIGRLGAKVTGDESVTVGSSLDSASNLESVMIAAYSSGEITGASNALSPNGVYTPAASKAYNFIINTVPRGANGIISQRIAELQYWADMLYMGSPALAAYGLYAQDAAALQEAYTQIKLDLDVLLYPAGSGSKSGLMGHIRNEDGSWADPEVWVTGQGWTALGVLRVVAALGQSGTFPYPATTASNIADLLRWTGALLTNVHATFDASASLWYNYVDTPTTFHDISGSLALAAATYRLATIAPALVDRAQLANAEAVYERVVPHLQSNGQFGDGLQCVDALSFSTPGYTSVEALSFGVLLEAARRDFTRAKRGQTTALIRNLARVQL